MNTIGHLLKRTFWAWPLWAAVVGCAALKMPDKPAESITDKRQNRNEAAVREFGEKQDFAEFQAALAQWNQGDVDGCEEGLQELLGRNPDHHDAWTLLTNVLLLRETSRDSLQPAALTQDVPRRIVKPASSLASWETAGEESPSRVDNATDSATAPKVDVPAETSVSADGADRTGCSPETAAGCFREAASIRPNDPRIPISAAVSALQTNQPELAVELLDEAHERFADSAQILRILGTAHYRLGDFESSQVALQQALSLDKSSGLTYFLLGCTLAKLGQSDLAEEHFRQARTLDPKYAARQ